MVGTSLTALNIQKEKLGTGRKNSKPIVTIQAGPFEPPSDENFLEQDFPRWTNTDFTLYKFKTGWLIFYPGTNNSTEVNGFISISEDEKEMTVYHLWGD